MEILTKTAKTILDFIVITLLMAVSFVLVIPFVFVFVGITGYLIEKPNARSLSLIFKTIGKNFRLLWKYALIETVMLALPIVSIAFWSLPSGWMQQTLLGISWFLLVMGVFFLIAAPVLIVRMNLTFKQLVLNSILTLISGTWRSLLLALLFGGACYVGFTYPLWLGVCFYVLVFADALVMNAVIDTLKRKGEQKDDQEIV